MEPPKQPPGKSGSGSPRPLDQLFGAESATAGQRVRSSVGRQLFEYVLEPSSAGENKAAGTLLIVDHDKLSRDILARNLKREGYLVEGEEDGRRGLERLREGRFDMVLWEVELPGLRGGELLTQLKRDDALRHLPVVLLAESKDTGTVVKCIEAGADDYLPKPFNPALLKARIRACMERKHLRDQERLLLTTIQAQKKHIDDELGEATAYLRSLLPAPLVVPFHLDWRFIPSSALGGDCFGYHWIDEDHFALYLLDVCGHGVGAALLSVTAMNALRSGAFHVNFRDPSEVLAEANRLFPMESHGERYFTLWYGVYRPSERKITYGSGGHPPALLLIPGEPEPKKLAARGMVIGGMPHSRYPSQTVDVPPGSRLFLFCDGAYEITRPDGRIFSYEEFAEMLRKRTTDAPVDLDALVTEIRALRGPHPLEDDFTLISVQL